MRALWLAAALLVGCRANLPNPVEPLARTPGAAFRERAPERLPGAPEARLPSVRTQRLDNGLLVVVATRPGSRTANLELVIRGAGASERDVGAEMATGTVFALAEAPEATFDSDIDQDAAYLGMEADETSLDWAMKELAEAALRPKIEEWVVESTRRYLKRLIERQSIGNVILNTAYGRLYAEPPRQLDTRSAIVHAVTKDAILRQYERFYGPENAALVVAGPAPFEQVLGLAVAHFGSWKAGGRATPKAPTTLPFLVPSLGPRPIFALDFDDELAHAIVILPGPPKGFPGFSEYLLADVLLGSSLGSRGNEALRLHDAKSYGVASTFERSRAGSELQVYFAVEQDDFVESLQRMLGEIERLRSELVSTNELEIAKIAWQARLSSRLVTSSGTAALLREAFALDGDPAALGDIVGSVERVRPAEMQEVARREFTPDRMQVVVFASRKKHEAALRHVGPVWWHEPEESD